MITSLHQNCLKLPSHTGKIQPVEPGGNTIDKDITLSWTGLEACKIQECCCTFKEA